MLDLVMTSVRLVYDQVVSGEVLAGTKVPRGEWGKELYMLDLFMTNVSFWGGTGRDQGPKGGNGERSYIC